ncbi:hypothetical protein CROQUDRAFT_404147 [Cronartium quercuum f. sp. fusiforme G11]|uniref:Uncharacterized protein n=1 Tax=Cronartium quercuum f. sp. fusiforme G11 TaxID=708437 RepID=A0A9P6NTE6_9BASI|nr:hypothetical protein CROQUDRAFT_404147 [Cronartium quercuum f. sp. fusiforme G11]
MRFGITVSFIVLGACLAQQEAKQDAGVAHQIHAINEKGPSLLRTRQTTSTTPTSALPNDPKLCAAILKGVREKQAGSGGGAGAPKSSSTAATKPASTGAARRSVVLSRVVNELNRRQRGKAAGSTASTSSTTGADADPCAALAALAKSAASKSGGSGKAGNTRRDLLAEESSGTRTLRARADPPAVASPPPNQPGASSPNPNGSLLTPTGPPGVTPPGKGSSATPSAPVGGKAAGNTPHLNPQFCAMIVKSMKEREASSQGGKTTSPASGIKSGAPTRRSLIARAADFELFARDAPKSPTGNTPSGDSPSGDDPCKTMISMIKAAKEKATGGGIDPKNPRARRGLVA